jgi:uncharacterized protein YjbI with pentapeptide repeats
MRRVIGFLRQHLLLILGLFALLAITVFLWRVPAWPLAVMAVLQRHLLLIGMLGAGLAILILLWGLPKWQAARPDLTPQDRFTVENEARKTLAQIIGGAAVLAGLYFTWANLQITQDTATKDQEIAREGQITDRFTKAITQLGEQGPEKLAVRLGGIYALERIARDSPKDHWPIMEVLTAYVRENSPRSPKPQQEAPQVEGEQLPQEQPPAMPQQLPHQLATDIQAVLTVVGRRSQTYEKGETHRLNLANTDLRGVHLEEAQLQGADLRGAQLQGAHLVSAQLQGARLGGAHLERATLVEAQLQGAHLQGAQLQGAFLNRAQLQEASLWEAQLQGADLEGAQLERAVLVAAALHRANLHGAQLQGADLGGAWLQDAELSGAQLQGALLRGAQLKGARHLTVEQLSTVKTLHLADIDLPLLEQIQQRYSQLLEEPQ